MDSVTTLAAPAVARYAATSRTPGADEGSREAAAVAQAAPAPQSAVVTLSRRAQELAAQERVQEARNDDVQAAAKERQAATDRAEAAQESQQSRDNQAAQAAERATAQGTDAEAHARQNADSAGRDPASA